MPVVPLDSGGYGSAEDVVDATKGTSGSSAAAESIFYPWDSYPPLALTAEGAAIEVDSAPALPPLAAECGGLP